MMAWSSCQRPLIAKRNKAQKLRLKMDWRLTFGGLLALAWGGIAIAQPTSPESLDSGGSTATRSAASHSVHWQRLRLRDAIERIHGISDVVVYLDRRVDPTQRVSLALRNAPVDGIVDKLAEVCSLGTSQFKGLIYLGPVESAERLPLLVAQRREEVARLPNDVRRTLVRRQRIAWARLTQPRDLVVEWAREQGLRVRGGERIPHDLWPAGELPAVAVTDQLALLLVGFDLTFQLNAADAAIEIVPLGAVPAATPIADAAEPERPAPRLRRPPPGSKQVFTLRVQEQPVGAVLEALARQLEWELEVDEAAIRRGGGSLDRRVSFVVENVEIDELLEALLQPAGLSFERDGKRVRIEPR
jgi:hypothetical protein